MKNILTALTLVLTFSLVGCGSSAPGPGDTVKDLAYAMEAGDSEKIAAIAPAMQQMLGNEKLAKMAEENAKKMEEEGGITAVTIDSEEINEENKTAKVTATIEMGNGEKETEDFTLSQDKDGNWIVTLGDDEKGPGGAPDIDIDLSPGEETE